jgi:hypothetical protein
MATFSMILIRKKKNLSYLAIFLILLLTRIFIYPDHVIVGADSIAHFRRFLEIMENPAKIFNITGSISTISPSMYGTMLMLEKFGGIYILPFSFIGISCISYLSIVSLIRRYSSFVVATLGIIFSIIEYMSFRFGFEIRTFIFAFLFMSLWAHSIFIQKFSLKNQFIHLGLIITIFLTHITTGVIVVVMEICISIFILIEKVLIKRKIIIFKIKSYPFVTLKAWILFLIGLIILIMSIIFQDIMIPIYYEIMPGIGWLFDVLLGNNNTYVPKFDLSVNLGITGEYLGIIGFLITWLSRGCLISYFIYILILNRKIIMKKFVSIPEFRLLLYISISLCVFMVPTLIFTSILNPSRIYVIVIIPIGILLVLSNQFLKETNKAIEGIIILFVLYTIVRYSQIFELVNLNL